MTETAVMLPLLVLLTFGSIELANVVFLKQSLAIASYEGARAVTKPGATQTQSDARIAEILSGRGVTGYTVTYTPAVTSSTARGTMITVEVKLSSSTGLGPMKLFAGKTATSQTIMVRL